MITLLTGAYQFYEYIFRDSYNFSILKHMFVTTTISISMHMNIITEFLSIKLHAFIYFLYIIHIYMIYCKDYVLQMSRTWFIKLVHCLPLVDMYLVGI